MRNTFSFPNCDCPPRIKGGQILSQFWTMSANPISGVSPSLQQNKRKSQQNLRICSKSQVSDSRAPKIWMFRTPPVDNSCQRTGFSIQTVRHSTMILLSSCFVYWYSNQQYRNTHMQDQNIFHQVPLRLNILLVCTFATGTHVWHYMKNSWRENWLKIEIWANSSNQLTLAAAREGTLILVHGRQKHKALRFSWKTSADKHEEYSKRTPLPWSRHSKQNFRQIQRLTKDSTTDRFADMYRSPAHGKTVSEFQRCQCFPEQRNFFTLKYMYAVFCIYFLFTNRGLPMSNRRLKTWTFHAWGSGAKQIPRQDVCAFCVVGPLFFWRPVFCQPDFSDELSWVNNSSAMTRWTLFSSRMCFRRCKRRTENRPHPCGPRRSDPCSRWKKQVPQLMPLFIRGWKQTMVILYPLIGHAMRERSRFLFYVSVQKCEKPFCHKGVNRLTSLPVGWLTFGQKRETVHFWTNHNSSAVHTLADPHQLWADPHAHFRQEQNSAAGVLVMWSFPTVFDIRTILKVFFFSTRRFSAFQVPPEAPEWFLLVCAWDFFSLWLSDFVSNISISPWLGKNLANEEKNSLVWRQLDSLADDPHELRHRNVVGHQKLAFVNVWDLWVGCLLDHDLQWMPQVSLSVFGRTMAGRAALTTQTSRCLPGKSSAVIYLFSTSGRNHSHRSTATNTSAVTHRNSVWILRSDFAGLRLSLLWNEQKSHNSCSKHFERGS